MLIQHIPPCDDNSAGHTGVLDLSTLQQLADMSLLLEEKTQYAKAFRTRLINAVERGAIEARRHLELLEAFVCFDTLLVDDLAITILSTHGRIDIPDLLAQGMLKRVTFPASVYEHAERSVIGVRGRLKDIFKTHYPSPDGGDALYLAAEKEFADKHDNMAKSSSTPVVNPRFAPFSSSGQSLERALFYNAISAAKKVSVILSSAKMNHLEACHAYLYKHMGQFILEQIRSEYEKSLIGAIDIAAPPLGIHILKRADRDKISILEAVNEIRNDPAAAAYRARLADLEAELRAGKRANATALLADIKQAAAYWAKTGDMNAYATHMPRRIRLSSIPLVGKLLAILDGSYSVSDPILWGPDPCFAFASRWLTPACPD